MGLLTLVLSACERESGARERLTSAADSAKVHGIVVDSAGNPIPGAIVILGDHRPVITRRSGAYEFAIAPGEYRLTAEAHHFATDSSTLRVSPGDTVFHRIALRFTGTETQWLGCETRDIPADTECVEPVRIPTRDLWVPTAGEWVFDTRDDWNAFWLKYWTSHADPATPAPAAPQIDWTTERLVAVGKGLSSGCSNAERYINRVLLSSDSVIVAMGPDSYGTIVEFTCMMSIAPVDIGVVPRRGAAPVAFRTLTPAS